MKVKLKSLAAALTLVAAGGAQAVETGLNSPSNLILQILSEDGLSSAVHVIDLTIDEVRAGEIAPRYVFDMRAALGDTAFDTLTAGDFTWAVVGGSTQPNADFGLVSTASGDSLPACDRDNCQGPTSNALIEFIQAADAAATGGTSGILDNTAGQAFAGQLQTNFSSNAGFNPFQGGSFFPGGFGQATLFDLGVNPGSFETENQETPNLAILAPNGIFLIGVPVPAAVWLFGSALAGLAAVGRRRA